MICVAVVGAVLIAVFVVGIVLSAEVNVVLVGAVSDGIYTFKGLLLHDSIRSVCDIVHSPEAGLYETPLQATSTNKQICMHSTAELTLWLAVIPFKQYPVSTSRLCQPNLEVFSLIRKEKKSKIDRNDRDVYF